MTGRYQHSLSLQLTLIISFVVIGMMLFFFGRSLYRDTFQIGHYVNELESDIDTRLAHLALAESDLAQASTPEFQEMIAKKLLGLRRPGERVLVLTDTSQDIHALLAPSARPPVELLSPTEKWARFVFGW